MKVKQPYSFLSEQKFKTKIAENEGTTKLTLELNCLKKTDLYDWKYNRKLKYKFFSK